MADWQKVYENSTEYRVEIVKSILVDRSISAIVVPKKDTAYQFGHFEVMVHPDDVLKAIKIINEEIRFE